jgi:hypothetical protein
MKFFLGSLILTQRKNGLRRTPFQEHWYKQIDRFSALTEAFGLPCDSFVQKGKSRITFLPYCIDTMKGSHT